MLSGEMTSAGLSLSCKIAVPISWESWRTFLANRSDTRASNLGSLSRFQFGELSLMLSAQTNNMANARQKHAVTMLCDLILPGNEQQQQQKSNL